MLGLLPDLKALSNRRFETSQLTCKINGVIQGYSVNMSLLGHPKKGRGGVGGKIDSGFP